MWLQKWTEAKVTLQRTTSSEAEARRFGAGSIPGELGWKSCLQPSDFTCVQSLLAACACGRLFGRCCACPRACCSSRDGIWSFISTFSCNSIPLAVEDVCAHWNGDERSIWYSVVAPCCLLEDMIAKEGWESPRNTGTTGCTSPYHVLREENGMRK